MQLESNLRMVPGTLVTLDGPDYGTWQGQVVVCLCKRHAWQQQVANGGPGRECGHAQCGYPPAASACPWPVHVRWKGHWSDTDGPNESHENPEDLRILQPERQCA